MKLMSSCFLLSGTFILDIVPLRWRPALLCAQRLYGTQASFNRGGYSGRGRGSRDNSDRYEKRGERSNRGGYGGGSIRPREREERAERGPRGWTRRDDVRDDAWQARRERNFGRSDQSGRDFRSGRSFDRRDQSRDGRVERGAGRRDGYGYQGRRPLRNARPTGFKYTDRDEWNNDEEFSYSRSRGDRRNDSGRTYGQDDEYTSRARADFSDRGRNNLPHRYERGTPGRSRTAPSSYRDARDAGPRSRYSASEDEPMTEIQVALASSHDLLYGIQPVHNALRNARRAFYKLYVQNTTADSEGNALRKTENAAAISSILALAKIHKVDVSRSDKGDLNVLAGNRPHQGFVLEVSPLAYTPLKKLPNIEGYTAGSSDQQEETDELVAEVNGSSEKPIDEENDNHVQDTEVEAEEGVTDSWNIQDIMEDDTEADASDVSDSVRKGQEDTDIVKERELEDWEESNNAERDTSSGVSTLVKEATVRTGEPVKYAGKAGTRTPCWLALDEVSDPQNLGALLRSAHFLGVTGIFLSHKNCSRLSPVVSKASAGAMEMMEVHSVGSMPRFLRHAAERGWRVIATAVEDDALPCHKLELSRPTVIVLGSEGSGLRTLVRQSCTDVVEIVRASENDDGIDSLNVSVAGGIVLHQLLGQHE
eukprot:Plantae.Rhodophyta-Hildenbrandia_rubra.ctg35234.p1 GENE.Plantae.Rhodophyta-Hildenbrandia_rubra.ctg35234~~Plantae.Rhodophyta-Hildenbrandia_rubra.ctg35234.p1  ORF type:complete len:650 (+),score=116.22 Plantae.Rhodophyta-Hildenbrandia_rubra.ctg35234:149-2098(+)